jgi:hypothetical protein
LSRAHSHRPKKQKIKEKPNKSAHAGASPHGIKAEQCFFSCTACSFVLLYHRVDLLAQKGNSSGIKLTLNGTDYADVDIVSSGMGADRGIIVTVKKGTVRPSAVRAGPTPFLRVELSLHKLIYFLKRSVVVFKM